MPQKTWGTRQKIKEFIRGDENSGIQPGQKAYVYNTQRDPIAEVNAPEWDAMIQGDLSSVKEQIEAQIPNSKVIWLQIHWDKATFYRDHPRYWYAVEGFYVEAIVENTAAAGSLFVWTAGMIIAVFIGAAILAAVIAVIVMVAWLVWVVISSVPEEFRWIVALVVLVVVVAPVATVIGNLLWGRR